MTVTTLLLLSCVGAAGCDGPPALPSSAPVYIKVVNLEQVNMANDLVVPAYPAASGRQGSWGVLKVDTLEHGTVVSPNTEIGGGGGIFFADDGPGGSSGQITAIFYGIQNTSATASSGGTIDFFWHAPGAPYITAACASGATCAPDEATVTLFTGGTFLARVALASGIDPGDPLTCTKRDAPLAAGGISHSASFANVDTTVAGPWTDALNGDWFTTGFGTRDIRLTTVSMSQAMWSASPAGTAGLRGNDPIRVFTR
jgi:hypothetical protein